MVLDAEEGDFETAQNLLWDVESGIQRCKKRMDLSDLGRKERSRGVQMAVREKIDS